MTGWSKFGSTDPVLDAFFALLAEAGENCDRPAKTVRDDIADSLEDNGWDW